MQGQLTGDPATSPPHHGVDVLHKDSWLLGKVGPCLLSFLKKAGRWVMHFWLKISSKITVL